MALSQLQVLTAQALYFICVFIFNVAQPFVSKPAEVFWRHHIDRWYFLMFTQCAGMGGYFLLDWIFNCHGSDSGCSWDSLHGNGILWAHVEALVWAVAEFVAIPHSLRHGPWWIELAMALLLSLAWSLHYATFHALTNGLWVYGDPWSAGFFAMFFLIPLVHLIGAGLSLLRGLLYRCLAARWPKPFGWQLTLYEDASSTQVCVCWPRSRRGNVLDTVSVPLDTQSESLLGVTAADAPEPLHDGKADHGCMPYCISCSVGMLWPVWATVCAGLFVVAMFDIVYAIECSR
jgi:hypothetical protein